MNFEIDKIDRKLLKLMQCDGRMSNAELAEKINVSPATCHRRTQRLFDEGIITHVRAQVNPQAVGCSALVTVGAILESSTPESFEAFEQAICKFPFVLECYCVAGDFDYLLKVRVRDTADFNRLHRQQLLTLPNVRQLRSFFVLKEVVENAPLDF
ncbi:AsnC family transcriptional regulator [Cohaesibacter celericrescens]|uniref:AsnC family transcriptional regulator n=2 Tax=Cohaesibacter celericrescens TaxID=2067669 RepID=A0A2N5XRB6_9HYPH|nr:AsnC family transcriptional regulator [Cohaesibacter celericrescens]